MYILNGPQNCCSIGLFGWHLDHKLNNVEKAFLLMSVLAPFVFNGSIFATFLLHFFDFYMEVQCGPSYLFKLFRGCVLLLCS